MDITKMMELSYNDLRALFMRFLRSQDIQQSTINTAYSDAFYLWRKEGKDLFWKVVNAPDFEEEAKRVLSETLSKHLAVNAEKLEHCLTTISLCIMCLNEHATLEQH